MRASEVIWVCCNCGAFWKQHRDLSVIRDEFREVYCSEQCAKMHNHPVRDVVMTTHYL